MVKTGFSPENLRTFVLVGHRSAGKTTLGDALLQAAGVTRRMGRVSQGTSLLDHKPSARRRQMTIEPSFAWMCWGGTMLQMVDMPGGVGFIHQSELMIANTDAFLLAVSAPDGLESGAERALELAGKWGKPGACVLNKIDRPHERQRLLDRLQEKSGMMPVLMQWPFYDEFGELAGLVDLLSMKVLRYGPDGEGEFSKEPIPLRLQGNIGALWERAIEAVALTDDSLLETYLEYLSLEQEDFLEGLYAGVRARKILPVFLAAAEKAVGAVPMLEFIVKAFPATQVPKAIGPQDFAATVLAGGGDSDGNIVHTVRLWSHASQQGNVWINGRCEKRFRIRKYFHVRGPRRCRAHTLVPGAIVSVWNVSGARPGDTLSATGLLRVNELKQRPPMIAYALQSRVRGEKFQAALDMIALFDHGLSFGVDEITQLPTVSGQAQVQLERAVSWLNEQLGADIEWRLPAVGYRETIRRSVAEIEGLHERSENGLVEEFGACKLTVTPGNTSEALRFEECVAEDEVPQRFLGSIAEGVADGMLSGPSGGYPVTGLRVKCTGGDYDFLQSTEEHFRMAAKRGLRLALLEGGTRILEPWKSIEVSIPQDTVGNVLADLSANRARISGLEVGEQHAVIRADCPMRELRTLAPRLSTLTAGRGWFRVMGGHYAVLPDEYVAEAIASSPQKLKGSKIMAQGPQKGARHRTSRGDDVKAG